VGSCRAPLRNDSHDLRWSSAQGVKEKSRFAPSKSGVRWSPAPIRSRTSRDRRNAFGILERWRVGKAHVLAFPARARRPRSWRARRGLRLGRPKARPQPSIGARCPGSHTCTRPRAWHVAHPPGSRRGAQHCHSDEVRHPALSPASSQARVGAQLAHNDLLAR
jgi:hypothetical protein